MMASKKELQEQIDKLNRELTGTRWRLDYAHRRELAHTAQEHRRRQDELRKQEREARAKHLSDLADGTFHVSKAREWQIQSRPGSKPTLHLTFELDADELTAVQRSFGPKVRPMQYATGGCYEDRISATVAKLRGTYKF